jgi:hypothetical protein
MSKIYVIGPMIELQEINRVCEALHKLKHEVRCVKPIKTTYQDAVRDCYNNIAWCDTLVVIAKSDGRMGESVIHELCFAEYFDKTIYIIRSNE